MTKAVAILLVALCSISFTSISENGITVPDFDDDYSKYVKRLEAGETDIDYQAFRFSFIESQQFVEAAKQSSKFRELKKEMYKGMGDSDFDQVIDVTKRMLSIDYTSMIAHKILRQTYKIVGDTANAAKYKAIQFGLLKSIVEKGDGKSYPTAWKVIQLDEEYFIGLKHG